MNPIQSMVDYLRSAKAELEKVSWPSKQETIRYSAIVIAASVISAVVFGALDFGLGRGVTALLTRQPSAEGNINLGDTTPPTPDLVPQIEAVTKDGQPAKVEVTPLNANPSGDKTAIPADAKK